MSDSNRQVSLELEAMADLKAETSPLHDSPQPSAALTTSPTPAAPTLGEVLAEIGPLPSEALFLGIASDGLPVLLNLHDPRPGPILIIGDAGAGKTAFLQSVARSLIETHDPNEAQFGVVTNRPDEWENIEATPHHVGVFPVHEDGAKDFLVSLSGWAHANKIARQSVILLVDDLEEMTTLDSDALQSFRWLLLRGPTRRVWPLITLNAERYEQVVSWLPNFRTRVFGRIADGVVAEALGADKLSALDQLEAPIQFSLRENGNWLRFWLLSR